MQMAMLILMLHKARWLNI